MLRKSPGARKLGIAAAIASICSMWTCCLWIFNLGLGIYALIVLARDEAKTVLNGGEEQPW